MNTWLVRRLTAIALVVGALVSLFVAVPPVGAVPPAIHSLRTDGQTLVWIYSYYTSQLQVRSVGDSQTRTLAEGVTSPDVSGDRVIWEARSEQGSMLAGIDLRTDSALELPAGSGEQMEPSLSGSQLVWVNKDSSGPTPIWTIMTADLSSNSAPQVVATLPSDMSEVGRPEISGSHIVWSLQYGGQGAPDSHWELWSATIGSTRQIASGSGATDNLLGYDTGGDDVVYASAGNVHLLSGSSLVTNDVIGSGYDPTTDGRYVFWTEQAGGPRQDIHGYDTQTHSSFVAVSDANVNYSPWAANDVLAWLVSPPYTSPPLVYASLVTGLLPSGPRPNPGTTSPNWFYFPETSHYLAFGFKQFWAQSGGLPVFGYPLTEEFSERNPDLGTTLTVQYLERQRFEYHPELSGTPYEVELGRLGAEDATTRNLTGTQPFQPMAIPSTAVGDTCLYFGETHHTVCGDFLPYWQTHGLGFGDPGYSYRESLALFGYPISEPYVDPQTGLLTQYFERAVFEYHPENPVPYQILLKRLGANVLAARGW